MVVTGTQGGRKRETVPKDSGRGEPGKAFVMGIWRFAVRDFCLAPYRAQGPGPAADLPILRNLQKVYHFRLTRYAACWLLSRTVFADDR